MESAVVDRVLVAERDSHFRVAKAVPLAEEHVGHVAAGVGDNAMDAPEFVAARMHGVTAANLHVATGDDIGRANWLEPRYRAALDLLARDGVVLGLLDHLLLRIAPKP